MEDKNRFHGPASAPLALAGPRELLNKIPRSRILGSGLRITLQLIADIYFAGWAPSCQRM